MKSNTDAVRAQIYSLIRETLNREPAKINKHKPWQELGVESFDLVELIVALRDHFKIQLKTKDLNKINTLHDLIVFTEKKSSEV